MQKREQRAQNILEGLDSLLVLFAAEEEQIENLESGLWSVWPGLPGRPTVQEKGEEGLQAGV